ncbi:Sec-independent protein translocase protein TatB [Modicisalibacter luteus]|uniref:Sec-independent protein translocase protein TatB n=1 Tax=Modicisalibacter luteus TaxID=453962 RepID=A0ABV7LVL0_9GAMM|nr:Sec-independent protein translocase protein TatB [Halomonas lutea]GHB06473.1 sec-independent protein translocase protein TatB [Halomonas lutea]
MFDIGFLELLIIGVVGLLVLGPERLPKAARTVGLWIGKTKRTVANMQREINAQLEAEDLRQKLSEQEKKLNASLDRARQEVESYADSPAKKTQSETSPDGTEASGDESLPRQSEAGSGVPHAVPAEHEPVAPSTTPTSSTASDDKDSQSR